MPLLSINAMRAKCQNIDSINNTSKLDPRIHPIQDESAAHYLKDVIKEVTYYDPKLYRVKGSLVDVLSAPSIKSRCLTQLLRGEFVDLYKRESGGFGWIQNLRDGYVGYVKMMYLTPINDMEEDLTTEAMITAPKTFAYKEPDLKSATKDEIFLGSFVSFTRAENGYAETKAGYITEKHLVSKTFLKGDWLDTMLLFQGVPYLWGGKSFNGIDCSGLVQLVLNAYGIECPRDSDQQAASLGHELDPQEPLQKGDFVFFKGHVGIMVNEENLLHANQTAMSVTIDRLDSIIKIAGPITRRRRLTSK